ncbi:hypothetical protein SAMN02745245_01413 [Anaerosphaera aminiphila DSM 21120]|uniref:DUF4367 domain-containing protein n=1 Tax=Anaerosphaera aminiphila DSM 21120 TaxID=1120995 RepID=A0A1M5TAE4_9FIRM|nr:DUF4367 domain-containing protein [Anaerosphaera aminiphila]SHH47747.1 hypothetical protein SAMN02745245_01413 [Anaerosphaera aminiphila DSM 21120]
MNREDKFSKDIDEMLKIEDFETLEEDSEYVKDLEFARKLSNLYSSDDEVKEEVHEKMKENKNKKKKGFKVAAVAAVAVLLITPMTSTGQELYRTIKEAILPSGRVQIIEEERVAEGPMEMPVPEELKGQLFDKDGNELAVMKEDTIPYNKDGEKVSVSYGVWEDENGVKHEEYEVFTEAEDVVKQEKLKIYEPVDKVAEEKLAFNPLVLKDKKYEYKYAMTFAEDGDNEKSEYGNFIYEKGGKEITLYERVSSEESGYGTDGENVQEVDLNGVSAIYYNNNTLDFERDGLLVGIHCKDIGYDELVEIYNDLELYK